MTSSPNGISRLAFVLALLLVLLSGSLFALGIPPKPTAWVTDRAAVFNAGQQQQLNQKLEDFYKRSGSQMLVFVYPSLEGEALEDYTVRVAEQWKTKGDRALILFVFVQDHKMRIEVGYGLEGSITDATSSDIVRNTMAPAFRQNDYFGGINAALDRMIAIVEKREQPIPADLPSRGEGESVELTSRDIIILLFILFVIIFFVLPLLRRGGCGGCIPIVPFGGGGTTWGGGGGGWSGGGGGGGGGGWNVGGSWGGGGGGSFGGGGASGSW